MKSYKEGEIQDKLLPAIASEYRIDIDKLEEFVYSRFPSLKNIKECPNCGASMENYVYSPDCLNALLVYGMGKIVKERLNKGIPFTEANKVHVQSTLNKYYSVPSRTSQCAKLGLITKVRKKSGVHDSKAGWLITSRGWAFLRGEPIPAKVQVFRNRITEHFEETITIDQAFQKHRDLIKKTLDAGKEPKYDYRSGIDDYKASDWYEIGPVEEGKLI